MLTTISLPAVVVLQGCTVRDVMKAVERDVSNKSRGMSFSW